MEKNYVFLHGFTGTPDDVFWPWLRAEMEGRGHRVQQPTLPDTDQGPILKQMQHVLDTCEFNEHTVLVAHSLGVIVGLKVLEQLPVTISHFVSCGGFMSPKFKDKVRPFEAEFNWELDTELVKTKSGRFSWLRDPTDSAVPFERAEQLQAALDGTIHDIAVEDDHFCGEQEPALLEYL